MARLAAVTKDNTVAENRLKLAAKRLESQLPPPDQSEADDTVLSEVPTFKPRPRQSSIASCALCADELASLAVGDRGGHVCSHQQGGPGGDEGDDEESVAGSATGPSKQKETGRGGKKKQPDAGVIKQYMDELDDKLDAFIVTVSAVMVMVEEDLAESYEEHMMAWSDYCEGLKDRARDVIAVLRAAQQVDTDRQLALQLARSQQKSGDGSGPSADLNGLDSQPADLTPPSTEDQSTVTPISTGGGGVLSGPHGDGTPPASTITTSSVQAPIPAPPVQATITAPSAVDGSNNYANMNLELAVDAFNSIQRCVEKDIQAIDAELLSLGGVITDSHAEELKIYCKWIEEKIRGDYVRAGEKVARLDLDKKTNVRATMSRLIEVKLDEVRKLMAKIRRLLSGNSVSNSQRSDVSASSTVNNTGYKPYLERLKPPVFTGKVEDWPEFRSVWMDMLSTYPESVQVQHFKANIPSNDAKRIAGVKTMAEVWRRMEKVYGDTQLNILTVKANIENLVPKATESYKRVLEVYEAVETAVTQLTNLDALQYVKEDFGLMSKILLKLPSEYQDEFAKYITKETVRADPSSRWDKFWVWMERLHRRAVESSLMNMCGTGSNKSGAVKSGITCHTCGAVGHISRSCPNKGKPVVTKPSVKFNMAVAKITSKNEYDQHLPEVKKQMGNCPVCKKTVHVYTRQFPFGKAEWPSRRLESCPQFKTKSVKERGELIEKLKGCYKCTAWSHAAEACFIKGNTNCTVLAGGQACAGAHHMLLHGSGVAFCHKTKLVAAKEAVQLKNYEKVKDVPAINQPVLLEVQAVPVHNLLAKLMWDGGSSGALVTHSFAERAGLKGRKIAYWLVVVGHPSILRHTMLYDIVMVDNEGAEHEIQAYGIDQITDESVILDLSGVMSVFPGAPKEVYNRPDGPIDILVGSMYKDIQPCGGDDGFTKGRLRLVKSLFGCGYILTGTHPAITASENTICYNARNLINNATMANTSANILKACNPCSPSCSCVGGREGMLSGPHGDAPDFTPLTMHRGGGDEMGIRGFNVSTDGVEDKVPVMKCARAVASLQIPEFFEAEEMGVSAAKACKRCRGCKDCSFRGLMISREKEMVVKRMEDLIKYDEQEQKVSVTYPWTEDVRKLTDNIGQAIAFQKSYERRLVRDKFLLDAYNKELRKAMDRGAIVKLSQEEIQNYTGPVSYVAHHGVHKPDSATTPLRSVTNTSLVNVNAGLSPNQCMQEGPNALSSLLVILIGFRMYEVALVYDMTKAYQSMNTGELEKHVRRLVWRWGDVTAQWEIYAYAVVTFGDQIAGLILELVKKLAADMGSDIDIEACHQIRNKTYVDDGAGGGTREQVERFRGELVDGFYNGTLARILALVGLKLKVMIASGDTDEERLALMGEKLLGHVWRPPTDKFAFKVVVNLSTNKRKGQKTGKDLTVEDIPRLPNIPMTKRMLLGLVMSQYDPMGLISPLIIILKIQLRELYGPDKALGWDEPIPEGLHRQWEELIAMFLEMGEIEINRAVRPAGVVDPPELIGFADGSLLAYACAIYIRWTREKVAPEDPDRYVVQLVCGKARVTSVRGTTAPRSEMCGFLILTRLLKVVVEAMDVKPAQIDVAVDSQCTISALEKSGGLLAPYFASRVSEAVANMTELAEHSVVHPVQHVPGPLNPADIPTRDKTSVDEVKEGSIWQSGPAYLALPKDQWPFSRQFLDAVPQEELRAPKAAFNLAKTKFGVGDLSLGVMQMVVKVMEKSNNWAKTVHVTARLFRGLLTMSREKIKDPLTVKEIQVARTMQFVVSSEPTIASLNRGELATLRPELTNGVVYTTGRCGKSILNLLGIARLPILARHTRLAMLIMIESHEEDHRSTPSDVLARSRQRAWIIRGRYLAKSVCKACPLCRRTKGKLTKQLMAEIPRHQLQPCPPFTFVSLDFAGPYQARAMGNSRAFIKLWGLVIICQNTRAVKMYATAGYSTDDFLTAYHRFTANHANPLLVVSDAGTQLRKAGQVIEKGDPAGLNWDRIRDGAAKSGTNWKCVEPGCQWRNGLAEAAVKLVKTTLAHTMASQTTLNYAELDTLFSSVANIVNQRPIAVKSFTEEDIHAITPNDLLLQRSKNTVPGVVYGTDDSLAKRQETMREIEELWWNQWIVQALPHLVPFKKWRTEHRSLCVGDIVLVLYEKKVGKGTYKLGRVVEVHPDDHGVVRTVTVGIKKNSRNEKLLPYVPKPLTEIKLGVQRVAVICPVEEQVGLEKQEEQTGLASPDDNNKSPKVNLCDNK